MSRINQIPNLVPALLCLGLGLGLGGYGGWQLRQAGAQYQATARVQVHRDETDLVELPADRPAGTSDVIFLQNEAEVVRSAVVLEAAVRQLELAQVPGVHRLGGTAPVSAAQAQEWLRQRVQVASGPGPSGLEISAASESPEAAQELANGVAQAYCSYRAQRRLRIMAEGLAVLVEPFRQQDAKYQQAAARLERARAALPSAVRQLETPPQPQESESLRERRRVVAQLTMIFMVQSNQLVRSQHLPPEEQQRMAEQFHQTTNQLHAAEVAVQTEAHQQVALQEFWQAHEEWSQARQVLAPIQREMETLRARGAATNQPAATIVEQAERADKLPARHSGGLAWLVGAVGALLTGAWLLGTGQGKPKAA